MVNNCNLHHHRKNLGSTSATLKHGLEQEEDGCDVDCDDDDNQRQKEIEKLQNFHREEEQRSRLLELQHDGSTDWTFFFFLNTEKVDFFVTWI